MKLDLQRRCAVCVLDSLLAHSTALLAILVSHVIRNIVGHAFIASVTLRVDLAYNHKDNLRAPHTYSSMVAPTRVLNSIASQPPHSKMHGIAHYRKSLNWSG